MDGQDGVGGWLYGGVAGGGAGGCLVGRATTRVRPYGVSIVGLDVVDGRIGGFRCLDGRGRG